MLVVSILLVGTVGDADEVEYRLIRDLLRNYDHRIRPSLNASEPLNVTFGLALAQIIDVVRTLRHSQLLTSTNLCSKI